MRKNNEVIVYKNSQKRFAARHAIYFITTNTHKGFPYFAEDIFCESFLDDLMFAKETKQFKLYGYKINDDHIFLDHMIRGRRDFLEHIKYIRNQWIKHNQPRDKFCYINDSLNPEPSDYVITIPSK
jgi:hypothetical protein